MDYSELSPTAECKPPSSTSQPAGTSAAAGNMTVVARSVNVVDSCDSGDERSDSANDNNSNQMWPSDRETGALSPISD